jgi:hypothetical protein
VEVDAMKKLFGYFLELALLVSLSSSSFGQSLVTQSAEFHPQITVRVYNRVLMPPDRLAEAEQVGAKILRRAEVQTVWLDCTVATGQWPSDCDNPLGPTDFLLQFVEEIQSLSPQTTGHSLGFAALPDNGLQADRAYISYHRAHDSASRCRVKLGLVLGVAAAHEIGHMLMGSNEHSRSGLMQAQVGPKDMQRAERSDLLFTDDQVKQIRVSVLARIAQFNVPQVEAAIPR